MAGGNGIASALPALEELAQAGVITQGLPTLLLWVCRKGHEFAFMAAPVVAAARALGLNLTLQLYITGVWMCGVACSRVGGQLGEPIHSFSPVYVLYTTQW